MSAQPIDPYPCDLPIDTSCCSGWDDYDEAVQDRSVTLAFSTLRALSGYRIAGCPTTVRPCRTSCGPSIGIWGQWMVPVNWAGTWFNCVCGGDLCGCTALCEVELPGPVASIQEVSLDGQVLPAGAYRVDNGRFLVRTDGQCWPDCQDMAAPLSEPDTFGITYAQGVALDSSGAYALGVLACEFAKACSGSKCRLPSGVTSISRQGVSMEIGTGAFPDGLTGIREVDAYVLTVNPNRLVQPSTVWAPGMPRLRETTVG